MAASPSPGRGRARLPRSSSEQSDPYKRSTSSSMESDRRSGSSRQRRASRQEEAERGAPRASRSASLSRHRNEAPPVKSVATEAPSNHQPASKAGTSTAALSLPEGVSRKEVERQGLFRYCSRYSQCGGWSWASRPAATCNRKNCRAPILPELWKALKQKDGSIHIAEVEIVAAQMPGRSTRAFDSSPERWNARSSQWGHVHELVLRVQR